MISVLHEELEHGKPQAHECGDHTAEDKKNVISSM